MAYEPENLERWKAASNYGGASWTDWFVVYERTRDSGHLTNSNYDGILAELEKLSVEVYDTEEQDTVDGVCDTRAGHWACGWVETILVHKSAEEALQRADELIGSLLEYPVLDEEDLSDRQYGEAADTWERMDVRERCQTLIDHCRYWLEQGSLSLFCARRDELPRDPDGSLIEYLGGAY